MRTLTKIIRFFKNKVFSLFTLFAATLLLFVAVPLKSQTKIVGGESATYHPLGALLLSESEYNRLPAANWAVLRANAPRQSILKSVETSVMLACPPVGNQGSQGSCVAWAVGYSATAILAYPKYGNWDQARRSPAYVYNQLKTSSDCSGGLFTTSALNLTKTQGVCSWEMMPYTSTCSTLPNANQKLDASLNNTTNWWTLATTNVDGIKEALQLGYPVVVAFNVYTTSFDRMWREGGIWSTNDTSGTLRGGHACCIVGYDDSRQMFKVQNSWGTSGGDNGFFWVTYNLVRNRIFKECYVLQGMNPTALQGPKNVPNNGAATYTIVNLPTGTSVTWSVSNSNLRRMSSTSNSATFKWYGSGSCDVTAKLTKNGATVSLKVKNVITLPSLVSAPRLTVVGQPYNYYPVSPTEIPYNGELVMEEPTLRSGIAGKIVGGGDGSILYRDRLEVTSMTADPQYDYYTDPRDPRVEVNGNKVYIYGMIIGFSIRKITDKGVSEVTRYVLSSYGGYYPYMTSVASITIQPNPATDYVTVSVDNDRNESSLLKSTSANSEKYEIRLVNLQGKVLKTLQVNDVSESEISLQGLQAGVYYIHILKDGEVIQREKLMKK